MELELYLWLPKERLTGIEGLTAIYDSIFGGQKTLRSCYDS
jgi:hypothetical protein